MESYFIGVEVKACRVEEQSNRCSFSLKTSYFPSKGYKCSENDGLVNTGHTWSNWFALMQGCSQIWDYKFTNKELQG